ncbi:MAG: hypothetical protein LBP59_01990 [Planctomycetaceae bacterium]|nr:hypothetical protein [Planctomycetaceae bacterium]
MLVLEIQRFKSVKACRPITRQADVNANSSANKFKNTANQINQTKSIRNSGKIYHTNHALKISPSTDIKSCVR